VIVRFARNSNQNGCLFSNTHNIEGLSSSNQKYLLTRTVVATAVVTKATIGVIGQIRENLNLIGSFGVDINFVGILLVAVVVRTSRSSGQNRPATVVIFPTMMMTSIAVILFHSSISIYILK